MTTLVLGAGISGIAAAHDLRKAGQAVTVLEARDRIGGRIYTRRDIVSGIPVELGAEFLHGERVPLWDFVEDLNLHTFHWQKMDDSLVRMEDDRLITMREARTADPEFALTRTWNLPDVPVRAEDDDLYHYLSRLGFTKEQLQYTRRSYANATGESIHRISAAAALEEMRDETFGDEDWRILDGYDTIVQYLAIGLDVRLNTTVKLVEWGSDVIKVTADNGATFECERLILAVPVGVLTASSITFDPPLPEAKINVLRDLSMGPGLKMIYVFDEPILPDGIAALYSKHNPPMWWSPTFGQVHARQFAITAFATGEWARLLYQMDETGMIVKGLEVLRKELGEVIPDPVQTYVQNWTADPLAGGVYSVVAPGGKTCREYLAQPTDSKLYWAGEATAPNAWAATVHGAYTAGRRAAKEVLEAMQQASGA